MPFKQKIYNHFLQGLNEKINLILKNLDDLKETGANETKSTAGDKHETALAMIQIEQENNRKQLQVLQMQKTILEQINPLVKPIAITTGSLIKTNKGYFYLSVALGKATIENIVVIALSQESPLGQKLMFLQKKDSVTVNNTTYFIESIE